MIRQKFRLFWLLLFLSGGAVQTKVVLQQPGQSTKPGRHTARTIPDLSAHEKEWNILIDIAGNNNLHRFVGLNLSQMEMVGSNSKINIICQVDRFGDEKMHRVEVHKGKTHSVWTAPNRQSAEYKKTPRKYQSGTKESVEDFLTWSIKKYPAKKQFVIFWNHGSGFIDPANWGRLITELHQSFFTVDKTSGKRTLNREDELGSGPLDGTRGIQFNDINGSYLTNQDLSCVLGRVRNSCLSGHKFDIVGMDACCMAGIEVASQLKDHTDFFIGSQEVELGAGWNYSIALRKAAEAVVSPRQMAAEIVKTYEQEYNCITPDYTLSVVDFAHKQAESNQNTFNALEEKIGALGAFLSKLLVGSQAKKIASKINDIRRKSQFSTWFYDNNYIDLHHFLASLQTEVRKVLSDQADKDKLAVLASSARRLLKEVVPYYTAGASFGVFPAVRARGMSIYFPPRGKRIHVSYKDTVFDSTAPTSAWGQFLRTFQTTRDAPAAE